MCKYIKSVHVEISSYQEWMWFYLNQVVCKFMYEILVWENRWFVYKHCKYFLWMKLNQLAMISISLCLEVQISGRDTFSQKDCRPMWSTFIEGIEMRHQKTLLLVLTFVSQRQSTDRFHSLWSASRSTCYAGSDRILRNARVCGSWLIGGVNCSCEMHLFHIIKSFLVNNNLFCDEVGYLEFFFRRSSTANGVHMSWKHRFYSFRYI